MKFPYAEAKALYLDTSKHALGTLRGWSEERVMHWARRYEWKLDGLPTLFYHETPVWYIAGFLVPQALRAGLHGYEYQELVDRVQHAIEGENSFDVDKDDFDWDRAKDRVNSVLRQYGVTLADCEDEAETE